MLSRSSKIRAVQAVPLAIAALAHDPKAVAAQANQEAAELVDTFTPAKRSAMRRLFDRGTGWGQEVVKFTPGRGAGFNAHRQDVVLGRPEGGGAYMGSLHVVSLGDGGSIELKLGRKVSKGIKIFENGFGATDQVLNPAPARVEVSADGKAWYTLHGEAGHKPVFINSKNKISPKSRAAGGDVFLFADSGIPQGTKIQYVRITDLGQSGGPRTERMRGFDLDGVYGF